MKTVASEQPGYPLPSRESGEQPTGTRDSRAELAPGSLIAGKYRVREVLGRGGFAVVYAAEHLSLGRELALKVLHRDDTTHAVLLERFAREMRISALVRHPHVLEVYDAGTLEDGSPFLAMEKIAGVTLQHQLDQAQRLSIEDALELGTQLLWALAALAERGIVHRDIKPENLMLLRSPGGKLHLKLLDFGISLIRQERIEGRLTQRGTLLGTPHYMAPEQLRSEVIDARVDLYATGVVLYQVLAGCLPYDGEDLSSLTLNVLNGEARALRELRPDCPDELARVVERALARTLEERYPDATSMLADLLLCRPSPGLADDRAGRAGAPRGSPRWLRRQGKSLLIALLAFGGSLGAGWSATRALRAGSDGALDPSLLLSRAEEMVLTQAGPGQAASGELPPASAGADPASADSSANAHTDAASSLARRALERHLRGETAAAYALYKRALQADATCLPALRGLGLSAAGLSRREEARSAYTRYLELAPHAADARQVRARLVALRD